MRAARASHSNATWASVDATYTTYYSSISYCLLANRSQDRIVFLWICAHTASAMVLCEFRGKSLKSLLGPNVYTEAPDGGWGYLVAISFFVVETFTYGTIKSFGIFLQDLMTEFGETNSRVSWIISISVFVMTFTAPLSSVMTSRFGFRPVVMTGGALIAVGTISTAFTTSIKQMYITTGVIAGLGYCFTFLPTVTILSQYFNHKRPLVTSLASTGESFAMFALAPAFSALRDRKGWRYTMVVIGALQGSIVLCGVLLRPIIIKPRATQETETEHLSPKEDRETLSRPDESKEGTCKAKITSSQDKELPRGDSLSSGDSGVQSLRDTDSQEKTSPPENVRLEALQIQTEGDKEGSVETKVEEEQGSRDQGEGGKDEASRRTHKLLDFSVLRECSFILYSLFGLFATLGFFAPQLYVIELAVARGVERDHAAYMLSAMAVAEVFGRLSIGWVLSRKQLRQRKLLVLLCCIILMTLVLLSFTFVREFWGLAVCCAFYGFFMGTIAPTHIPMLAEDDVVGIARMSSAAGVYVFIQSFAGLAGPPLGGVLVDETQNYGSAFYSCAVGMGVGAIFLAFVRPAKRCLPCCRRTAQKRSVAKEDSVEQSMEQQTHDQERDSPQDYLEVDVELDQNQEVETENDRTVIAQREANGVV